MRGKETTYTWTLCVHVREESERWEMRGKGQDRAHKGFFK